VGIIVCPLISLMIDQVASLKARGIDAAYISSANSASENESITTRLKECSLTLCYVTPELIATPKFRVTLTSLYNANKITLFGIDEVHCLSTWGHDFRPAYRQLNILATNFAKVPIIACTATATSEVIKDVQRTLNLDSCEVFRASFNRENVCYTVKYKDIIDQRHDLIGSVSGGGGGGGIGSGIGNGGSKTNSSQTAYGGGGGGGFQSAASYAKQNKTSSNTLFSVKSSMLQDTSSLSGSEIDLIKYIKSKHSVQGKPNPAGYYEAPERISGVIYVHNRKDTAILASLINKYSGVRAVPYHAGLKEEVRSKAQKDWMDGSAGLVVATIAFG
jgi:superfamily II DNA helicase RecQ